MAAETIRMSVDLDDDIKALITAARRLPKEVKDEIRAASQRIAADEADAIRDSAATVGRGAALAAESVRARRGETPAIAAGGRQTVRSRPRGGRVSGSDVFFGYEFGGGARPTTQQFPTHRGKQGYFFWPTLREDTDDIVEQWAETFDDVAARVWGD